MNLLTDLFGERPAPPAAVARDTTPDYYAEFEKLMALREGRRNDVYVDSRGFPTVGIGHLVRPRDHFSFGDRITDAEVDTLFAQDGRFAWNVAGGQMTSAGITDPSFQPYLASVCFQLGTAWTLEFPKTWAVIMAGQYAKAAAMFNGTRWANQTPIRVKDFQGALLRLPPKGA